MEARATMTHPRPSQPADDEAIVFRSQPATTEDTGLSFGQLVDLCVKTIYYGGRPSARDMSEQMALPFNVVDSILAFLKREQFVEVVGSIGLGE